MKLGPILAALAATGTGCAMPQSSLPTPTTLLRATRDPAQFRSALPHDNQGGPPGWQQVSGESCRTMLTWPPTPPTPFLGSSEVASVLPWPSLDVTWGNDGYARAVKMALEGSGSTTLVDVRADVHTVAVLSLWRRECVEVHGLVAK